MKLFKFKFITTLYIYLATKSSKYRHKVIQSLKKLRSALSQEKKETKEMLEIYSRWTQGQATDQEMWQANEQFRDILRGLGLGIFAVLPFAPITIPIMVKIGKKLGIDILPSSFKNDVNSDT